MMRGRIIQQWLEEERRAAANNNDEVNHNDDSSSSDGSSSSDDSDSSDASSEDTMEATLSWCCRLERNVVTDPSFEFLLCDETAFHIGRALVNNTHVTQLNILPASPLSLHGVKAFLLGLRHSRIHALVIGTRDTSVPVMTVRRLYTEAMTIVRKVCFLDYLTDKDAAQIKYALTGNEHLQTLVLLVGLSLTKSGASWLIRGIKGSNIKRFESYVKSSKSSVLEVLYKGTHQVPHVDICQEIDEDLALELAPMLAKHKTLKACRLDMRGVKDLGFHELADAIGQAKLGKLELNFERGFFWLHPNEFLEANTKIMIKGVEQATTIHDFCVEGILNGNETFEHILPRLVNFKIADSGVRYLQLDDSLKTATRLQCLQLISCGGCEASFRAFSSSLASALPYLTSLKKLHLRDVFFGQEGAETLARRLSDHPTIEDLELRNCDIGDVGVESIVRAVANHPSLIKLNLLANKIELARFHTIAGLLPTLKVRFLYLEVSATSHRRMKRRERRAHLAANQAMLAGLRLNVYLYDLTVEGLLQSSDDENLTNFYICANRGGRYLLHTHHDLSVGVWSHILSRCRNDPNIVYHFLQEQPTLVPVTAPAPQAAAAAVSTTEKSARTKAKRRRVS